MSETSNSPLLRYSATLAGAAVEKRQARVRTVRRRAVLHWILFAAVLGMVVFLMVEADWPAPWCAAAAVGLFLAWGRWFDHRHFAPQRKTLQALQDAMEEVRQGEYGVRLREDVAPEIGELVSYYNAVATLLQERSDTLRQRELLVTTIVDQTRTAILVVNAIDRVVFASRHASDHYFGGARLEGFRLSALMERCPEPLRVALAGNADSLVAVEARAAERVTSATSVGEEGELLHVQTRHFELNGQGHRLVVIRSVAQELRRQELGVWKKAIRVICHELNNALAPVSSLVHSAKVLADRDNLSEEAPRLIKTLTAMTSGVDRLRYCVEAYASYARLPLPQRQWVALPAFVDSLQHLVHFQLVTAVTACEVSFDASQVQQALVNLLRNAHESGSPVDAVVMEVIVGTAHVTFEVLDRGCGVPKERLREVVLPLVSTKAQGTGLGLAIAREVSEAHGGDLSLLLREGGGMRVRLRIPVSAPRLIDVVE